MQRWVFWICLILFMAGLVALPDSKTSVRVADGFDMPVGKPNGEGYYMSRGYLSYNPGEDWNGVKGGNSDLGDPVYAIGNGYVTFAHDARMGWGNVVILRHAYVENGKLETVDSMYAHLDKIHVKKGQQVKRGQQIGTIGTNRGMYTAHLHYEVRKNLFIGINRSSFGRNLTNYHRPGQFIAQRRKLPGGGRTASIPINTYKTDREGVSIPASIADQKDGKSPASSKSNRFRVNRFGDMGF